MVLIPFFGELLVWYVRPTRFSVLLGLESFVACLLWAVMRVDLVVFSLLSLDLKLLL